MLDSGFSNLGGFTQLLVVIAILAVLFFVFTNSNERSEVEDIASREGNSLMANIRQYWVVWVIVIVLLVMLFNNNTNAPGTGLFAPGAPGASGVYGTA